jgi:hypothetical protein
MKIKGTTDLGLMYRRNCDLTLKGWSDSDYAGGLDDRKSTSGYVFMVGSGSVSWSSKKQAIQRQNLLLQPLVHVRLYG